MVAVISYSSTGNVHQLAKATAEGSKSTGRHRGPLADDDGIEQAPHGRHRRTTALDCGWTR
ncbi:hypothetical protein [Streptomyces sp. NPDC001621]|uniref:hypothetical protein n=1 Tax=Streptomyces sp. NPDC001621 TaxID=3364594 RepID=UPI0036919F44